VTDRVAHSAAQADAAMHEAASRARVAVAPERKADLAAWFGNELATISGALGGARSGPDRVAVGVGAGGMPLRSDGGAPYAMARPLALVAPVTRLGYVLVPRLAPDVPDRTAPARAPGSDVVAEDAFTAELAVGA
jgi:DNA mismatch repair protein MutH